MRVRLVVAICMSTTMIQCALSNWTTTTVSDEGLQLRGPLHDTIQSQCDKLRQFVAEGTAAALRAAYIPPLLAVAACLTLSMVLYAFKQWTLFEVEELNRVTEKLYETAQHVGVPKSIKLDRLALAPENSGLGGETILRIKR